MKICQVEKKGQGRASWPDGLHIPCSFDGQAGGGAKRCPHIPVSKGRGMRGTLGAGVWGGRAMAPKPTCWVASTSHSSLAHTVDGEAPGTQSSGPSLAPCLARACCLPGQRPEAALISRPARASSTQG